VLYEELINAVSLVSSGLTEDAYNVYLSENKELSATRKTTLRDENVSLTAQINRLSKQNKDRANQLLVIKDERMIEQIQIEISEAMNQIDKHRATIAINQDKLVRTSMPTFTLEEYKILVQLMTKKFKKASMVQKDIIIRNIFLNLQFDGKKITNGICKEPFATLVSSDLVSLGWG